MRSHIDVSSRQVVLVSTKLKNTPFFSYTVIQIMLEIYLKVVLYHLQLTYSMVLSYTGVPRSNLGHPNKFQYINKINVYKCVIS